MSTVSKRRRARISDARDRECKSSASSDRTVQHFDRIKAVVDIDRPSLRFVNFNKLKPHVEPVTVLAALRCTPAGVDLSERSPVIFFGTDRTNLYQLSPLKSRYGQRINAVVLGVGADELHERYLPPEIERDFQAIVSSCNFESDALPVGKSDAYSVSYRVSVFALSAKNASTRSFMGFPCYHTWPVVPVTWTTFQHTREKSQP